MTRLSGAELREVVDKVFHERTMTLSEAGQAHTLEDYQSALAGMRRLMRHALEQASETAFERQTGGEGEAAWSAGQVVAHIADSQMNMAAAVRSLAGMAGTDAQPHDLERLPSRDEALAILDEADPQLDVLLASIPAGADLTKTAPHQWFGEMNVVGWLMLMTLHENDHVQQVQALG